MQAWLMPSLQNEFICSRIYKILYNWFCMSINTPLCNLICKMQVNKMRWLYIRKRKQFYTYWHTLNIPKKNLRYHHYPAHRLDRKKIGIQG